MNCTNGAPCACSTEANSQAVDAQQARTNSQAYRAPANVVETAEKYQITLDVPGSSREAIDIDVHEGILSVTARVAPRTEPTGRAFLREYGIGDFRREFRLGEDITPGAITATYAAGVLTLDLPKARKPEARRVPVTVG